MIQTGYPKKNGQCTPWDCLIYNGLNPRVTFTWKDEKRVGVEEGHRQSEEGASYMSPLYEDNLVDPYTDSKGDTETVVIMSAYGAVLGWQPSAR